MRTVLPLILISLLVSACSCSHHGRNSYAIKNNDSIDYYATLINRHIHSGRQDSVIVDMTPRFYKAMTNHDSAVCQLLGASIAQAWLQTENKDSVRKYIDLLSPYMKNVEDGNAFIIYHNMLGSFALKYNADYSGALTHYLKVLDKAKINGSIPAQITMLYNIVYIFYIRKDPHCLQYAEQALMLSEKPEVSFFTRIAALIAMTEAEYLNGSYSEASEYLRKAHEETLKHNTGYWNPIIYMLQGDILTAKGQFDKATHSYGMALSESSNSEPSTTIGILYNYGNLCQAMGQLEKASELYREALDKASETGSTEFLIQLLKKIVGIFFKTGDINTAAVYYNKLTTKSDSLDLQNGDNDFKNLLFEYSALQYEYDITKQSLELSENRRTTALLIFLISLAALSTAFVLLQYSRQKKENKKLIAKYEEYRKRLMTKSRISEQSETANKTDIHYDLYIKMEQIMKSGLFREKDLTLDKMADTLGTNRTYVSNALNKVAGISFYGYIDSYRIKEATRILSDPELSSAISLKQLADEIGYNNMQTFFKAFKRETGVTPGNYKKEVLNLGKFTENEM